MLKKLSLKHFNFFIFIYVCALNSASLAAEEVPPWFNELFGDGDFDVDAVQFIAKHLSSSTEDLIILYNAERQLLHYISQLKLDIPAADFYLKSLDYDLSGSKTIDAENYVSHPINAFHLMKRTSTFMPLIKQQIGNSTLADSKEKQQVVDLLSSFVLPDKKDFAFGASYGIISLQDYHDFEVKKLSRGIIEDHATGTIYRAESDLSSEDLLQIASISKNVHRINAYVSWCEAALDAAKREKKSQNYISKIKKLIAQGKKDHDEEIIKYGFFHSIEKMDPKTLVYTNLELFDKKLQSFQEYKKARALYVLEEAKVKTFQNVIPKPSKWKMQSLIGHRIGYYLTDWTKKLCRGEEVRPAEINKDLKCFYVDHKNPFLRLGPFKYELKHRAPEIGLFHDLVSHSEMEKIKAKARGHMKSTPYVVSRKAEEPYTRFRTSKVLYLSDHREEIARKVSDKIQLAMRFNLYNEQFASENYQTMNYGIGGTISGHVDSMGNLQGSSELFGGPRVVTFMVYMSEVPLGGHTVFPQAGVTVKPVAGNALYWFNHDTVEDNDSRTFHLGCPVAVGNKWIANKWIKWTAQMWKYPCTTKQQEFSIHLP